MFRHLDELCRRHLQTFDQEVITEGKKLVRSDLAKLVHKRFDKLADYETAKATHKNVFKKRKSKIRLFNSVR